ncbi:glycosyltransferase family 2 protein [Psychrobacter sp. BF1]|uniref:glycosyltransferase family 2 protein n=1 Tax=Psychrobacter sp. BF1 TaxID=2821147 RepID=UPI001C4E1618|nr:glycosyltransferase family 2 protein [Psychrobacter sp. BF1]
MFSIVIPLYNKELSITNTINSVLRQTYQKFEIIIVNDGSTDASVKAVESIKDDRIILIHKHNEGVSSARNSGIYEARYEWIALLDGDDLWEPNHLEEIIKMMKIFPKHSVYATSFKCSDKRKMFKHIRKNSIFEIQNYYVEALSEYIMWTSIVVIKKECLSIVGGFNPKLKIGEDVDLWARLAKEYVIIKSATVTAIYRVDAENRTSLSKNIENLHVYYYNLSDYKNLDEYYYYKKLILHHLVSYFFAKDYINFNRIKNRHPEISYNDFFIYLLTYLTPHVINKLKFFKQTK